MIGQFNIQKKIKSFALTDLPHSILIEGDFGSGKHLLVSELTSYYGVNSENITDNLNYEYISGLFLRTQPYFYIVDGVNLSVKSQNALLKFLEEPNTFCYIFVLCESKNNLLDTICNRCYALKMEKYSQEELKNFSSNLSLLTYCTTPGQVLEFNKVDLSELEELCDTILTKIGLASIPNILTISSKFDFGKEPTKFNIDLFCMLLLKKTYEYCIKYVDKNYEVAYNNINSLVNELKIANVDKKKLFEEKLLELKFVLRDDHTRT